jgi:dTDP-4-dehydrorhamnose 3,5-epimerase-like enzyme
MNNDFYQIIERRKIVDPRGFFLKTMTGFEPGLSQQFGEIYVIMGEAGQARANHYHNVATEWFTLLHGRVHLNLRHVDTGEHASLLLDEKAPLTVRISPRVAHSLMGVDEFEYLLMAYTDVRYDPADTLPHPPIGIEPLDTAENAYR